MQLTDAVTTVLGCIRFFRSILLHWTLSGSVFPGVLKYNDSGSTFLKTRCSYLQGYSCGLPRPTRYDLNQSSSLSWSLCCAKTGMSPPVYPRVTGWVRRHCWGKGRLQDETDVHCSHSWHGNLQNKFFVMNVMFPKLEITFIISLFE